MRSFFQIARLRGVLTGARMTYIVVRYVAAVVVALEALFFARSLGPSAYGSYAIIAQIAILLMFVTLGSNAGYVYGYFKRTPELDRYYVAGAVGQFLLGAVLVAGCFTFLRPYFLIGVLLFLIQVPYLLTEPMLRVRNYFTITALGRGLPALITLVFAAIYLAWQPAGSGLRIALRPALVMMVIGNLIGYAIYYRVIVRNGYLHFEPWATLRALWRRETWRQYWKLVLVPGLPLNASTIIIVIFQNVDRLFIEHYRAPEALSVYSLAWQLSQGVLLMLTSMNLVSGVRVGERMSGTVTHIRSELKRQFVLTVIVAGFAYVALVAGTAFLSVTIYRDYSDLVLITVLLSAGYLVMNIIGSITGLLFYEGRARQLTLGYLAVLAASVAGNVVAIRWHTWYGLPIAFTSLSLIVLNLWFAAYIYSMARTLRQVPTVQPA